MSGPPRLRAILVPGTWARKQEWWMPGSPWRTYVEGPDIGLDIILVVMWDTRAGGTEGWRRLVYRDPADPRRTYDHWGWRAGAELLNRAVVPFERPDCRSIPPAETVIISHSHGNKPVAYACAEHGLRVDRWLDIAGPGRAGTAQRPGDMAPVWQTIRDRGLVRRHLHVHSDGSDRMQLWGDLGDGHFGFVRKNRFASDWYDLPRAGHSRVVHDAVWMTRFWPWAADWLRQA